MVSHDSQGRRVAPLDRGGHCSIMAGMHVEIRRAVLDDARGLAELAAITFTQAFGPNYSAADLTAFLATRRSVEIYRDKLQEPGSAAWIAVSDGGRFVGYVLAGRCRLPVENRERDAGEIRELYVDAAVQNGGIGTRLLETVIQWLQREEMRPLYVGVWSLNYGAQRLYERYGFQKVGEYDYPVGQVLDREFILRRPQ